MKKSKSKESVFSIKEDEEENSQAKEAPQAQPIPVGLLDKIQEKGIYLGSVIGSGAYSDVYLGFIPDKNKEVAVKIIDLEAAQKEHKNLRITMEIDITKKLQHKNIIKTYYILTHRHNTKSFVIIVMKFAAMGTLGDHIRKNGSLPENVARPMFKAILEAVGYMHSVNVAHRDLKVENVLLSNDMEPMLSDFTLSIDLSKVKRLSQTFCGTLPYFPPEILAMKPYDPKKADVWSLGVTFYVALNNKLPFPIEEDHTLILNKQLGRVWSWRDTVENVLSREMKALVGQMLEPDLDRRPTVASLLNQSIFK